MIYHCLERENIYLGFYKIYFEVDPRPRREEGGDPCRHTVSLRSMFCSEQKSFVIGIQLKYLQISQSWIGVT